MPINISHQCLVRSQTFIGIRRFLAGLFVFWSRRPVVSGLRASGRNWFRTIIMTTKKTTIFGIVFHNIMLSCKMWSVTHANEQQKLVMQPETDIGSELPLTSFSITHPGLAAVRVAMF